MAFEQWDQNHDGRLDPVEFQQGMERMGQRPGRGPWGRPGRPPGEGGRIGEPGGEAGEQIVRRLEEHIGRLMERIPPERRDELARRLQEAVARAASGAAAPPPPAGFGRRSRPGPVDGDQPPAPGLHRRHGGGPPADGAPQDGAAGRIGERMDRLFNRLDRNNDGGITADEFRGPADRFQQVDANADGRIDREEFCAGARERLRRGAGGQRRQGGPPPPPGPPPGGVDEPDDD
jgi:hypothetical protein